MDNAQKLNSLRQNLLEDLLQRSTCDRLNTITNPTFYLRPAYEIKKQEKETEDSTHFIAVLTTAVKVHAF